MNNRVKLILGVVALAVSFAFGRFLAPTKIVEKTVTQTTEDSHKEKDVNKDVKKNKKTKTVIVKNKDGSKTITKTTEENTDMKDKSKIIADSNKTTKTETEKETTFSKSDITISGLAAFDIKRLSPTPVYGGAISKKVLGPISVGGFGLMNGLGGLSLGVSF